jgi:hypothetical protein
LIVRRLRASHARSVETLAQVDAMLRLQGIGDIAGWMRVVAPGLVE